MQILFYLDKGCVEQLFSDVGILNIISRFFFLIRKLISRNISIHFLQHLEI